MGNYPWRRMNHKLTNGMKIWKGKGNTITLLFSLKWLEILHQERRGQVNTVVIEHFNRILFHRSWPANKQHTYQTINQSQHLALDSKWRWDNLENFTKHFNKWFIMLQIAPSYYRISLSQTSQNEYDETSCIIGYAGCTFS